jgi:hypothetical protein
MKRSERTISRAAAVAAAFLLALAATPTRCEAQCPDAKTIGECLRQARAAALGEAEKTSEETIASGASEESADLEAMPTGIDTGGATLQSTTKDLVPLAAIAGLLGQGDGTNDQGDLVANLNFLLPGGVAGRNSQLQAVATTKPTLSAAVREALPESSRDDLASTLTEKISGGDQFAISFTYNLQGLNRGRNFELYRNRYRALVRRMVEGLLGQQAEADALFDQAGDLCQEAQGIDDDRTAFADIREKCGEEVEQQARALIAQGAAAFLKPLSELREGLKTKHFDRFGELVANQPQLHVSLTATEREPLVGADTTSGKLTYEWARVNLAHAMSEDCHRRLEQGGDPGLDAAFVEACAREYTSYVTAHAAEIAEGERISLTLEYESVESLLVPLSTLLPDADVEDLRSPSSKTRIAKLGWSRNFGGLQGQPTRFDLVAGYEDVTDDAARRDRLVATATMNLKFGELDVPFGIVYANHGKYLGEVDKQFSAHLGLKFDLKRLAPTP